MYISIISCSKFLFKMNMGSESDPRIHKMLSPFQQYFHLQGVFWNEESCTWICWSSTSGSHQGQAGQHLSQSWNKSRADLTKSLNKFPQCVNLSDIPVLSVFRFAEYIPTLVNLLLRFDLLVSSSEKDGLGQKHLFDLFAFHALQGMARFWVVFLTLNQFATSKCSVPVLTESTNATVFGCVMLPPFGPPSRSSRTSMWSHFCSLCEVAPTSLLVKDRCHSTSMGCCQGTRCSWSHDIAWIPWIAWFVTFRDRLPSNALQSLLFC